MPFLYMLLVMLAMRGLIQNVATVRLRQWVAPWALNLDVFDLTQMSISMEHIYGLTYFTISR